MGSCVSRDSDKTRNNLNTQLSKHDPIVIAKNENGASNNVRSPSISQAPKFGNGNVIPNSGSRGSDAGAGRSGQGDASSSQQTVIALYTYNAKDDGDLSFRKGDRLLVLDGGDPDWWLAKHMTNGQKGYIPRNYVVSEALETEE